MRHCCSVSFNLCLSIITKIVNKYNVNMYWVWKCKYLWLIFSSTVKSNHGKRQKGKGQEKHKFCKWFKLYKILRICSFFDIFLTFDSWRSCVRMYILLCFKFHRPKKKDEKDKKSSTLPATSDGIAGMAMETMSQWQVNELFEQMLVSTDSCYIILC